MAAGGMNRRVAGAIGTGVIGIYVIGMWRHSLIINMVVDLIVITTIR